MRVRFRGITEREVALIEGPTGWGEFGAFVEYRPDEAAQWLASALEDRSPAVAREQLAPYRLETYQKNLLALLESTGANPATETPGFVDPAAILAAFAGPGAFHFLRSAAPAPTPTQRAGSLQILDSPR